MDLVTREGAKLPFYGFGTSPILAGGVLVVPVGAEGGGAIAGFDRHRGRCDGGSGTTGSRTSLPSS